MLPIPVMPPSVPPRERLQPASDDIRLLAAAQKLEATFLSEMLKSTGFDRLRSGFDTSQGEQQFTSFLRESQAEHIVAAGGIGLAESLFNAMKARTNAV